MISSPRDLSQSVVEGNGPEGEPLQMIQTATAGMRPVILCIEDEPECLFLIQEELEERSFEAVGAPDGREGLKALRERKVNLVLCDVNMPGMSGFEMLTEWNRLSSDIAEVPFVFLTGASDKEKEMSGWALGADDFVTKPIDFDILHPIIDARLGRSARLRIESSKCDPLTPRERGFCNIEQGSRLVLHPFTL